MIPMQALIIGAIVKIILTYYLTAMPILNIRGAALGTVIGFAVAAASKRLKTITASIACMTGRTNAPIEMGIAKYSTL